MFTTSATLRSVSLAALSRWGSAAFVVYISPRRLTSTMRSHSSSGDSSDGPLTITPAALTRVSRRPSSSTVLVMAASAAVASVKSAVIVRAVPQPD
jgi:hypothetical protein